MEIKLATSWRISAASRLSIAPFASASASDAHGRVGMSAADRWRTSAELAPEPLPSWLTEFSPQQETSPEAEAAQA